MAGLESQKAFRHDEKAFAEYMTELEQSRFVDRLAATIREAVRKHDLAGDPDELPEQLPLFLGWAEEAMREHLDAPGDIVSPRGRLTSLRKDLDREKARASEDSVAALEHLSRWAGESSGPRYFALLGEYGIGKTTTCQALTEQMLDARERGEEAPLPLYLDLRCLGKRARKQPKLRTIIETVLIDTWTADRSGLEAEQIVRLVREHGALVIFDGLDEVLVHLDPGEGQRFTRELWSILPPRLLKKKVSGKKAGRVLISCRTHYFRTLRDQSTHLTGEDREGIRADDYAAMLLLPFEEKQIRTYLEKNVPGRDPDELIELLAGVHNLTELAERPYLLKLISEQIERIEEARMRGEVVTGVSLYRHMVQSWLERDEGKHQLRPEHKMRFMEHLAAKLWQSGARSWQVEEVEELLLDFLEANPKIERRYRLKEPDLLLEDLRTATFLVRPGEDEFRFAHTSLQEFFLASYLLRALREKLFGGWSVEIPSPETLDFLGQMLQEETDGVALGTLREIAGEFQPKVSVVALAYALRAVEREYPTPSLAGWKLDGADLLRWKFRGPEDGLLDMRGACFRGCDLRGAVFERVDVRGADFEGADLQRAEILESRAEGANFDGSRLIGALFRRTHCDGARWQHAEIDRTSWWIETPGSDTPAAKAGTVVGDEQAVPERGDRCLLRLQGHWGSVHSSGFSPDGEHVVSSGYDGTVRLWEVSSGRLLHALSGHSGRVLSSEFSPDGEHVVSSGLDGTVRLWEVSSGRLLHALSGHSGSVLSSEFSPDGEHVVSSGDDGTVRLWEVSSGRLLHALSGHSDWVRSSEFSPDGEHVVSSGDDGTVRLWEVSSGRLLHALSGHSGRVLSSEFSPDGEHLVSSGDDGTVRIWDVATGQEAETRLCYLPGGEFAVLRTDGSGAVQVSPGAWRWLGWMVQNAETGEVFCYPAETLGPLPEWTPPDAE